MWLIPLLYKHTITSVKLSFLTTPSYRNKNSTPHYYHYQKTIKDQIIRSRHENGFVTAKNCFNKND